MSHSLKNPPVGDHPNARVVEGGIALCHGRCNQWVAFTVEELTPMPENLQCDHCGVTDLISLISKWVLADMLDEITARLDAL